MNRILAIIASLALAIPAWAASITCTFTAADNTLLEDYSNGAEATWTENTGFASGNIQVSDANRVHTTTTSTSFYYVDNFTPANYNYDVEATVRFVTVPGSNQSYLGIGGRATSTSASGGYLAMLAVSSGVWQVQLLRYGAATLQTVNITTPSVSTNYQLKMEMRDHTVRISWNGSVVLTYHADTSTANYLTGVGYPTLWMDGISAALTDSTGMHVDDYTVTDAAAVATTGVLTVDNDDLWFNGYDGTGNPRQSPFCEYRFTTNAQIIKITGTTDMEDDYEPYNNLGLWVDGVWTGPAMNFTANGTQTFTFYLTSTLGTTKTVQVVGALQSWPLDEPYVQGSYIDSVELQDHFTTPTRTIIPPSTDNLLVVYGDSITVGAFTTTVNQNGWAPSLRWRWGTRNVQVEGYGFKSFYETCSDGTARQTFAERIASYNPQYFWMAIGTNDYGLDQDWNAADFGTAYGDFLDKLHAEAPDLKIYCQSPIRRISPAVETINGEGSTLADYRNAISTAVSTRTSFCTYVDGGGTAIVQDDGYNGDGIHLDNDGALQYANFVHNTVWKTKITGSNATVVGGNGTTEKTIVK